MLFLGNSKILLSTHDHDPNCSSHNTSRRPGWKGPQRNDVTAIRREFIGSRGVVYW